jgi:hypothetical protein
MISVYKIDESEEPFTQWPSKLMEKAGSISIVRRNKNYDDRCSSDIVTNRLADHWQRRNSSVMVFA